MSERWIGKLEDVLSEVWSVVPRGDYTDLYASVRINAHDPYEHGFTVPGERCDTRAQLAAAAPMLTRALLAVEWEGGDAIRMCPECGAANCRIGAVPKHNNACTLDAALTAAGLDSQDQRDAARRNIK